MKIKEIKKERKNASFKDPLNFQNDTCAIQNDRHFPYTLHPVKKYYCKKSKYLQLVRKQKIIQAPLVFM